MPWSGSGPRYWTEYRGFDALDRPASQRLPNGSQLSGLEIFYRYTGSRTDIQVGTDSNYAVYRIKNALGQWVEVQDQGSEDAGYGARLTTHFRYDAAGNPAVISRTPLGGSEIRNTARYNNAGHKLTMSDPERGSWNFAYNVLGELSQQGQGAGGEHASAGLQPSTSGAGVGGGGIRDRCSGSACAGGMNLSQYMTEPDGLLEPAKAKLTLPVQGKYRKYLTEDMAAEAHMRTNANSKKSYADDVEYGSMETNKKTALGDGTKTDGKIHFSFPIDKGENVLFMEHTHGSKGASLEDFSPDDTDMARRLNIPVFMGYKDTFKVYTPGMPMNSDKTAPGHTLCTKCLNYE